jgi:ubiquinone/menaquinone biosynthesis C-methylase UbiE
MRIINAIINTCYSRLKFLRPDPKKYSTIVGIGSVVPVQIEAYFLALNKYIDENANTLDVGFGLGYGLNILSIKSSEVNGVDVDVKVLNYCTSTLVGKNPRLNILKIFDGYNLPFSNDTFDVVTCVDVIEHVEDYNRLIKEMLRVSRKGVFLSTPNRRPENTNKDGSPKNYWHLREWSFEEFDQIIRKFGRIEWNFINEPNKGKFTISTEINNDTFALSPFIFKS